MSLRLRLTLTYGVVLIVVVGLFAGVLFVSLQRALSAEMDRRLQVRASQVELTIWPGSGPLKREELTSAHLDLSPVEALKAPSVYVQVLDPFGEVIAHSSNLNDMALPVETNGLNKALLGESSFGDTFAEDDHPVRMLSVPVRVGSEVVGILQVGQSRQPLRDTLEDLSRLLLILGAGAVGAAGLICWLVADRALRPLHLIADRAAVIAARRDFGSRVEAVRQRDEVGKLAQTVNDLLDTVEDTLRQHREFVADASHELRNPLLALQANIEVLPRIEDETAQAECLADARDQTQRLARLVQDLLLLARAEANQLLEFDAVSLSEVLQRAAYEASLRAGDRAVKIDRCEDIQILGDRIRVTQMLNNLVDNALRHTRSDGTITLSLWRENNWAVLEVADDGEGIAEEDLPRIFDRFFRAAHARSDQRGAGLGLAIVKHLAEAHGGSITVSSEPGRGSSFSIRLPLEQSLVRPEPPILYAIA